MARSSICDRESECGGGGGGGGDVRVAREPRKNEQNATNETTNEGVDDDGEAGDVFDL
jgi:hypothetical protein